MRKVKFIFVKFILVKFVFALALPAMLMLVRPVWAQDAQESLRDPTRPLGFAAQKAAEARLELQAIFIRDNTKEAVINGKSVSVGESVSGAVVTKIDEKSVRYRKAGKTGTLKLRESVFPGN